MDIHTQKKHPNQQNSEGGTSCWDLSLRQDTAPQDAVNEEMYDKYLTDGGTEWMKC